MASYLYVIGLEGGPVKIGMSDNPWYRLTTFQMGSPCKLTLFHTQQMRDRQHAAENEEHAHAVLKDKRLYGEWFDVDEYLAIEVIETGQQIEEYFEARARGEE